MNEPIKLSTREYVPMDTMNAFIFFIQTLFVRHFDVSGRMSIKTKQLNRYNSFLYVVSVILVIVVETLLFIVFLDTKKMPLKKCSKNFLTEEKKWENMRKIKKNHNCKLNAWSNKHITNYSLNCLNGHKQIVAGLKFNLVWSNFYPDKNQPPQVLTWNTFLLLFPKYIQTCHDD